MPRGRGARRDPTSVTVCARGVWGRVWRGGAAPGPTPARGAARPRAPRRHRPRPRAAPPPAAPRRESRLGEYADRFHRYLSVCTFNFFLNGAHFIYRSADDTETTSEGRVGSTTLLSVPLSPRHESATRRVLLWDGASPSEATTVRRRMATRTAGVPNPPRAAPTASVATPGAVAFHTTRLSQPGSSPHVVQCSDAPLGPHGCPPAMAPLDEMNTR